MFYVRPINGPSQPYAQGIFRRRSVDSVSPVSAITGTTASQRASDAEGISETAAAALNAYEKIQKNDTPRRRVLTAGELMSTGVMTILDSARLSEARRVFVERRFRHIPVVNQTNEVIGVLSDRDVLRCAAQLEGAAHSTNEGWGNRLVSSAMSHPVLTSSPDSDMREIARVMFQERIGCVPILDNFGQLVGIVTRSDVLRTLLVQAPLELWR